ERNENRYREERLLPGTGAEVGAGPSCPCRRQEAGGRGCGRMMPKERGRPVAARSAPHQTTVNANVSVSELLTAALGYAAAGWEVFALARDKSPAFRSPHADPAERAAC